MDGFEGKTAGGRYEYPFGEPPGPGAVLDVAPGVKWVRMPLPFSLKWINLWLIEDGDGWTVVDTGIPNSETKALWRTIFDSVLDGRPVRRIIITHMHPDHIGLAGWMSRKFQCELWMTRLEYVTCRMLIADTGREAPEAGVKFYRAAGWAQEDIDRYIDRFGGFGRSVTQLPDAFRRISDGDVIEIGGRPWHVVTGCGHSPDHACLFAPDINVFISGDQILPRISSNVSVFPTEPDADPLTDWLTSCAKLKGAIPADVLVLPAHNEPFRGAHRRLDALIQGHEVALSRMLERLSEPRRVTDLFGALFARAISPDILGMATGEAIAHLNCLQRRGLVCAEQEAGATLYRRAS